jgi:hypothetical protein
MKFTADPEFNTFDLMLVHEWIGERGWIKTLDHPFQYERKIGEIREIAFNIFDALKKELTKDLAEIQENA